MNNLIVNLRLPQLRMRPVTGAAQFRYERMVCGKWVSCNHSRATAIVVVFNRRVKALCAKLWPLEVGQVFERVEGVNDLNESQQNKLKAHINQLWLERTPSSEIITIASGLVSSMQGVSHA